MMFDIVKKAIDKHDPYGLLTICPKDEYDLESRDIASKIDKNSSVDEIAAICSEVFTRWFEDNFQKEDFIEVAQEIRSDISASR